MMTGSGEKTVQVSPFPLGTSTPKLTPNPVPGVKVRVMATSVFETLLIEGTAELFGGRVE